jgi:hypothetical protein
MTLCATLWCALLVLLLALVPLAHHVHRISSHFSISNNVFQLKKWCISAKVTVSFSVSNSAFPQVPRRASHFGKRYVRYDRKGVLVTTNVGPRDPTLLLVRCGVCGTVATLSSTLTRLIGRPTRGAFSSSRQASFSDMLPLPVALATRARRQPTPCRRCAVAAPASPPLLHVRRAHAIPSGIK